MRISPSRPTMLAGWLFADLFLVLVLIGLAAVPARPVADAKPVLATVTPPLTPEPSPTRVVGLDPHYLSLTINVSPQAFRDGARGQLLDLVNAELARQDPAHRQVGFVLVFAADDRDHIGRAVTTATAVVTLLHDNSAAFASSTGLGYWAGDIRDNFQIMIFLLN